MYIFNLELLGWAGFRVRTLLRSLAESKGAQEGEGGHADHKTVFLHRFPSFSAIAGSCLDLCFVLDYEFSDAPGSNCGDQGGVAEGARPRPHWDVQEKQPIMDEQQRNVLNALGYLEK